MRTQSVVGKAAFLLWLYIGSVPALCQTRVWERYIPTAISDTSDVVVRSLTSTRDGAYLLTASAMFGRSSHVAKLDSRGAIVWERVLGSPLDTVVVAVLGYERAGRDRYTILSSTSTRSLKPDNPFFLSGNLALNDFKPDGQTTRTIIRNYDLPATPLLIEDVRFDMAAGCIVTRPDNSLLLFEGWGGEFGGPGVILVTETDSLGARTEWDVMQCYEIRQPQIVDVVQGPNNTFFVCGNRTFQEENRPFFLVAFDGVFDSSPGPASWEIMPALDSTAQGAVTDLSLAKSGNAVVVSVRREIDDATNTARIVSYVTEVEPTGKVVKEYAIGGGREATVIKAVEQTTDGGFLLVGCVAKIDLTGEGIDLSTADFYAAKTDEEGNRQWEMIWGDSTRADVLQQVSVLRTSTSSVVVSGYSGVGTEEANLYAAEVSAVLTSEGSSTITRGVSLSAPAPNPTRGRVTVPLHVSSKTAITVEVLDQRGAVVAVLLTGSRESGTHPLEWNATNVAAGTYWIRATADGESYTRPISVVR